MKEISIVQDGIHSTPNYTDEGIPFFSVDTIINNVPPKYISLEDHQKMIKRCYPKKGDILLSRITGGILGFPKLIDWSYEFSIYVSLALLSNIKINSKFLYQYIQSHFYRTDFLSKSLLIASPPKINLSDLESTIVKYPSDIEQEKIANFFDLIDKKIEFLDKKHQYYQDFKKYLMQQIFNQKLRFDFNDEWNYLNFSKIFKSISTKKYQIRSAEIMDEGDFEVVDQGQDEIAGYFNDENKLCYELPIIIYGDHTTFVKFRDKPFIVGADGVKLLLPKINANLKYLFYALDYFNIKPEGYKRHFSIIKKINLPLPSLEEQNEISEMFISVDDKIMYTKKQLQETKKFKKSLLQQMFV